MYIYVYIYKFKKFKLFINTLKVAKLVINIILHKIKTVKNNCFYYFSINRNKTFITVLCFLPFFK